MCGNSRTLNGALPVRLCEAIDSRVTAWGIHIVQRQSIIPIFIPVFVVAVLTVGSTLCFIPSWLNDHPDDLEGATVPVVVAFTVVGLLLQLLVSLLVFRITIRD